MKAIHLQTEYLTEPLGMGIAKPRFYWNCEGGITQSAYRIVAKRDGVMIWDSGKVRSSRMTHIAYEGEPLHSRNRVEWSVRLWDENGQPGENAESWFELGLLESSDWMAQWIAGDYRPRKNIRYPVDCFQKRFSLSGQVKRARLYASARGLYDITVNGRRIEDFILAPGMTDYRKRIQYQTYDVTNLAAGENTLELRLADGWYRGSCAAYGVTNVYGKQTSVLAQLEILFTDDRTQTICTDDTWKWSSDGPVRFADLKDGEVYDAVRVPGYSGTAKVLQDTVSLTASDNVPVREKERFGAKLSGKHVLDFGQNIAGYLEFTVRGKPGQEIRLICGEVLDESGKVDLSGIQETRPERGWSQISLIRKLLTGKVSGESESTPRQEIVFTCSGGEDYYKTSFAVFGFRYVQIEGDIEVDPAAFTAIAVYSDMEQTGDFTCSDDLVNRLLKNTRWSMKGNFLDLPTDCPTRERLGWTGDAQIFFDTGAYLMNTAPFFRKWLRDMEDAQYKDGTIPAVLPYQGVEMMYKASGISAGWADAVYLVPFRYYRRFGDQSLLEYSYPMMRKYVDYLMSHLGLTDRQEAKNNPYNAYTYEKGVHLGEWLEPEEFQERVTAGSPPKHPEEATAYLHLTMKTMAEIAGILGKIEDRKVFEKYAAGSREAYEGLFVKNGTLDTNRQSKIVRPLALGLLDEKNKADARNQLVRAVADYNYRVGTGFLSTPFVLPVLTEAGESETAYKMLENTEKPGWLAEVLDGATTIWESWEGTKSRNHYSPGSVCQWLFEYVAGIRQEGENHFVVAPVPGGTLTWAQASYRNLYGEISSRWEKTAQGVSFTVTVPVNTTAEIRLPDGTLYSAKAGTHCYIV